MGLPHFPTRQVFKSKYALQLEAKKDAQGRAFPDACRSWRSTHHIHPNLLVFDRVNLPLQVLATGRGVIKMFSFCEVYFDLKKEIDIRTKRNYVRQ